MAEEIVPSTGFLPRTLLLREEPEEQRKNGPDNLLSPEGSITKSGDGLAVICSYPAPHGTWASVGQRQTECLHLPLHNSSPTPFLSYSSFPGFLDPVTGSSMKLAS